MWRGNTFVIKNVLIACRINGDLLGTWKKMRLGLGLDLAWVGLGLGLDLVKSALTCDLTRT